MGGRTLQIRGRLSTDRVLPSWRGPPLSSGRHGRRRRAPRARRHARSEALSLSTPATLEERAAADPYARWLGIELLEVRPGYCRAALTLAPHMVNQHGNPHGGAIFSLADFAFGGACNSHGEAAVALTVTIQFHVAARVGQRLVAEAREARQGKRAGFYTMTVKDDEDGTVVATCQAVSLRTGAHRPR